MAFNSQKQVEARRLCADALRLEYHADAAQRIDADAANALRERAWKLLQADDSVPPSSWQRLRLYSVTALDDDGRPVSEMIRADGAEDAFQILADVALASGFDVWWDAPDYPPMARPVPPLEGGRGVVAASDDGAAKVEGGNLYAWTDGRWMNWGPMRFSSAGLEAVE